MTAGRFLTSCYFKCNKRCTSYVSLKRAEDQAKQRMEKAEELRLLKAQYLQLQTEICRNDVKLHDYRNYQRFLESLIKVKGENMENDKTQPKKGDLLCCYGQLRIGHLNKSLICAAQPDILKCLGILIYNFSSRSPTGCEKRGHMRQKIARWKV